MYVTPMGHTRMVTNKFPNMGNGKPTFPPPRWPVGTKRAQPMRVPSNLRRPVRTKTASTSHSSFNYSTTGRGNVKRKARLGRKWLTATMALMVVGHVLKAETHQRDDVKRDLPPGTPS
jgi:hypothetical protein